jgi:hypothetical protein
VAAGAQDPSVAPPAPPPPGPPPPGPAGPPLSEATKFGCSRCRWGPAGCITCNPAKVARSLAKKDSVAGSSKAG